MPAAIIGYGLVEKSASLSTENFQEMYKYEEMPWEKWEDVLYKQPIQLKLFQWQ